MAVASTRWLRKITSLLKVQSNVKIFHWKIWNGYFLQTTTLNIGIDCITYLESTPWLLDFQTWVLIQLCPFYLTTKHLRLPETERKQRTFILYPAKTHNYIDFWLTFPQRSIAQNFYIQLQMVSLRQKVT